MGLSCFGWGRAVIQVLDTGDQRRCPGITLIWLGWATTLLLLQAAHFFFPLTAYVVAPIYIIGILFYIIMRRRAQNGSKGSVSWALVCGCLRDRSEFLRFAGAFMVVFAAACWIALQSMGPVMNYDSGLYHFNVIRWINSFPAVPGLGNLHGRLAFNQSFFIWVAGLNFFPFFNYGYAIANGFLFLLTVSTCVLFLLPALKRPVVIINSHPFKYFAVIAAFPLLLSIALFSGDISSPSSDLASIFLQITIFIMFVRYMAEWVEERRQDFPGLITILILSATAITIKPSNLAFAVTVICICMIHAWKFSHTRSVSRLLFPVALVILVWMFHGYVLSGVPFYPLAVGWIPVDWAVPVEKINDTANWVYSWARQSYTHWSQVLGGWEWFWPWMRQVSRNDGLIHELVTAVFFFFTALAVAFLYKKKTCFRWHDFVVLLPGVFGVVFWFFTAPDPRFLNASSWCLLLGAGLLFLCSVRPLLNDRLFAVVFCYVFLLSYGWFIVTVVKESRAITIKAYSGWAPIKAASLERKVTTSGLVVFVPQTGDQCWDAPLPCTPYFDPDLRLRSQGKLASGFTVGSVK
jgi:hypothetical protein